MEFDNLPFFTSAIKKQFKSASYQRHITFDANIPFLKESESHYFSFVHSNLAILNLLDNKHFSGDQLIFLDGPLPLVIIKPEFFQDLQCQKSKGQPFC